VAALDQSSRGSMSGGDAAKNTFAVASCSSVNTTSRRSWLSCTAPNLACLSDFGRVSDRAFLDVLGP